jgi:cytoskeletal protein RodZ
MTDPGLTNRLRQHSRRSGLMVGVTMALTIAICIVGFIWVFAQLEPYVSDFVNRAPAPAESQQHQSSSQNAGNGDGSSNDQADQNAETEPTEKPPTPTPKPKATSTTTAFNPDYQLTADGPVNLRSGPGVDNEAITTVETASPLQYLGEEQESDNPEADGLDVGQKWMKFRTDDGDIGWIREIDVEPYSP